MTNAKKIARLERAIRELETTVTDRHGRRKYGSLQEEEYAAIAARHRAEIDRLRTEDHDALRAECTAYEIFDAMHAGEEE